ncbi:DNA ligase 1 [Pleuronectes platessa]|uniref:DNA ligase 1 n=1 Tax=Pleuronectes platessa TaxID=8262 RepID=UPI00232A2C47|nr:DNA ligase 1 [Pleuronectes platessa]
MGYGLPLGVDARQAGIGALVTVATLKTSEGSGKTQTQCLFLRTEKGSCLYSTAKPGPGRTSDAASSGVGGWLRGKTGVGGRDAPPGRRDNGSNLPAQAGANRVRVRSGRRWRKSGNAAGREKTGVSIERQQRSREGAAGEKQEERDKGGLHSEQSPSMQQGGRRARQEKEKEGVCRSPRCCHNVSAKSCSQCGRREQRRESQDEGEGGEGPRTEDGRGMRKEKQVELQSSNSVLASANPDLESSCLQPQSLRGCDGGEIREAASEEPKTQTAPRSHDCSEEEQDSNCEILKTRDGNNHILHVQSGHLTDNFKSRHSGGSNDREATENPCEDKVDNVNGFPDCAEAERESAESEEEQRTVCLTPAEFCVVSDCYEDVSVSTRPVSPESSTPAGGSVCSADHQAGWVEKEQEKSRAELLERHHEGELEDEPYEKTMKPQLFCKHEDREEREDSSSLLRLKDPSILESEIENRCNSRRRESEQRDELESEEKSEEVRERELDGHTREETNISDTLRDSSKDVEKNCPAEDERRRQDSGDGSRGRRESDGDTCSVRRPEENRGSSSDLPYDACSDPSTSPAPTPANPDPSPPPLGSMATSLPCLEEEEEQEEVLRAPVGDGGQEGKRSCGREQEEERGSTVAAADRRKEEEEDEFGVFIQAEGEPACGGGVTMSAPVPCGSRASVAGDSTQWTQGWTDSSFHQTDDAWTAFPSADEGRDAAGTWWPTSAVEARRDRLSANQNLASVFAEAFPSPPGSPQGDPHPVPTLTQLLRGGASQDQGLLDGFHDLNKMIGQRYKRANGVSRDLLLTTLHLEPPPIDSRPAPRPTNRRLSPGLPSANQHAQYAAAKRRLSYDYNRNITE